MLDLNRKGIYDAQISCLTLCNILEIHPQKIDLIEVDSRIVVARDLESGGEGVLGNGVSVGTKLQLDRRNKLWCSIAQLGS